MSHSEQTKMSAEAYFLVERMLCVKCLTLEQIKNSGELLRVYRKTHEGRVVYEDMCFVREYPTRRKMSKAMLCFSDGEREMHLDLAGLGGAYWVTTRTALQ